MSLAKFVSLLETSCLFFARATKLGDPFEGFYPRKTVEAITANPEFADIFKSLTEMRKTYTVNCWYASPKESPAMWASYGGAEDAVAIRSTVGQLIASVHTVRPMVGSVKYIDYESDALPVLGNALEPIVHKQDVFAHEQEVRAVIWLLSIPHEYLPEADPDMPIPMDLENVSHPNLETPDEIGVRIRVVLNDLISSVRVSPLAQTWFTETIREVLRRYELDVPVEASSLGKPPAWMS